MAIDVQQPEARARLAKSVEYHDTNLVELRQKRDNLWTLYRGGSEMEQWVSEALGGNDECGKVYVNMVQQFAKGQILALAGRNPKWAVNARTARQRGPDKEIQNFLNAYSGVLSLPRVFGQVALDTVFGLAAVKIVTGLPPKGVTAPVAPRVYRLNPNNLIYDRTAPSFEECMFIGDTYLVPLNEAQNYEGFDPDVRMQLQEWNGTGTNDPGTETNADAYAEPMVRLIDVYLPSAGVLVTWPANMDSYQDIHDRPLRIQDTPINPYEVIDMVPDPQYIADLSPLDSLKNFHTAANTLIEKSVRQATQSKRNPVAEQGYDDDLDQILDTPDGDGALLSDLSKLDLYQIPGPDPSLMNLAGLSMNLFSKFGGNLEVALGQGAGAETARQTQALIQQVSSLQALDRSVFETFMSNVAYKLASLAMHEEKFSFETIESIPGTEIKLEAQWPPPEMSQDTMAVDEFQFDVVPYSSQFRTPQARIEQMTQATNQLMQLMQAVLAGAPLNMEVILQDYAEALDEVPRLREWWTPGQEAAPGGQEQPGPASINTGSDLRYQPAMNGGGGGGGNPFDISGGQNPTAGLAGAAGRNEPSTN